MVVPHGAHGRPISLKLPVSWVYAAAAVGLFSVILCLSSIVYTTLISRKLVTYSDTLSRSKEQQVVIEAFSAKTSKVRQAIDELANRDNELRKLLGLKLKENKPLVVPTDEVKDKKTSLELSDIDRRIAERQASFTELKNWVGFVQTRLESTPSSWPIYGRIASFFGYRVYPWRGVHTGIDITARYGAPVRATAPGIVSFVGWRTGYGKTVEINHGYGVATLYGHNSAFAVRTGQRVSRGQVVSYVGMTGWTTGPHVHYEVRRWDRPLNPIAFLDMNILSASRLWR